MQVGSHVRRGEGTFEGGVELQGRILGQGQGFPWPTLLPELQGEVLSSSSSALSGALLALTCKSNLISLTRYRRATSALICLALEQGDLSLYQSLLVELGEPADLEPIELLHAAIKSGSTRILAFIFDFPPVQSLLEHIAFTHSPYGLSSPFGVSGTKATPSTAQLLVQILRDKGLPERLCQFLSADIVQTFASSERWRYFQELHELLGNPWQKLPGVYVGNPLLSASLSSCSRRTVEEAERVFGISQTELASFGQLVALDQYSDAEVLAFLQWAKGSFNLSLEMGLVNAALNANRPLILEFLLDNDARLPNVSSIFRYFRTSDHVSIFRRFLAHARVAATPEQFERCSDFASVAALEFLIQQGPIPLLFLRIFLHPMMLFLPFWHYSSPISQAFPRPNW